MKKSILYVVPPSDSFAGVERVTHEIANGLMERYGKELDVSVLFCSPFSILETLPVHYKLLSSPIDNLRGLSRLARATLQARHYDVVVISQVEAATMVWLSRLPRSTKLVVWLHGNPAMERRSLKSKLLFKLFELVAARRFAAAFVVAPSQKVYFEGIAPLRNRVTWVPNPVRKFEQRVSERDDGEETIRFLSVGRLSYQKGYDNLIRAFSIVSKAVRSATLEIVGYGSEREALLAQIEDLGLSEKVSITYLGSSPEPAFASADIFVSSSRWEGWPIVIMEALSFGLPVIAMNCDYGPRDVLVDDRLGVLADNGNVEALAGQMIEYAGSLHELRRHADYRKSYVSRFWLDNVISQHFGALDEVDAVRDQSVARDLVSPSLSG